MILQENDPMVLAFNAAYHAHKEQTWGTTKWLGHRIEKFPTDLHVYQEILFQNIPDVVIETGTLEGGSAAWFASMFDIIGTGRLISIDINDFHGRPQHPRVTYIKGNSGDASVIDTVRALINPGESVMVVLDSDHAKNHVLQELHLLAPLVTSGQYLVVEDTNLNGHPAAPSYGPGPWEALEEFLQEDHHFTVDQERERLMLTANPGGYLKRHED